MIDWEEYLELSPEVRALVRFDFLMGLLMGEVQATVLRLCLEECGAMWDEDSGRFVVRG